MAKIRLKQHIAHSFGHYKWLLHLIFWSMLLGISYLQIKNTGSPDNPPHPATSGTTLFFIKATLLLLLSYTFQFAIVPLYRNQKKYLFWLTFLGALLLAFGIRVLLIYLFTRNITDNYSSQQIANIGYQTFTGFLFPFIFFIALYYFVDIYDQQKKIKRLIRFKTQKIGLESSFLKSQVNPHFLFNTLNNIYALSLRKSEQTPVIIEKLESLLHYMLYDCKADLVPLENEFTFTNSYIALEKLRHKEDQCVVTVTITGEPKGKMIAPLLLINFLENAFKHGTKTSFGKSWINLNIDIHQHGIHFKLQNSKPLSAIGQAISEYQGGIGLQNVERRLQILYPRRHKLIMSNLKDRFEIDLTINFQP
jgi:two-component system LytT family sensor kinase